MTDERIVADAAFINERGQCSACRVKPLVYKRPLRKFCCKCDRQFVDEKQVPNFAWRETSDGRFVCILPLSMIAEKGLRP